MPKQANPFDFTEFFAKFDPTKTFQELNAAFSQWQVPGMDMDAVMANQRKNFEALTNANKAAFGGMQKIAERQREILQQAWQEAKDISETAGKAGDPQQAMTKQAEIFQQALDRALGHMRELAEICAEANQEAYDALSKRFNESLAELRKLAK